MLGGQMIEVWSHGAVDKNMPGQMLFKTLASVGCHPWWQANSRLATSLLKANDTLPVLDIGCGWGATLIALEKAGYPASGQDVSLTEQPG